MTSPKKQKMLDNRRALPERGARGNKRGKPDIQVARRRNRQQQGRWQSSAEEVEAARQALGGRMEAEAQNPVMGAVAGAQYPSRYLPRQQVVEQEVVPVAPRRVRPVFPVSCSARGNGDWTMGQARRLMHAGYHIVHVMKLTGWGLEALADLPVDAEGYGLPHH